MYRKTTTWMALIVLILVFRPAHAATGKGIWISNEELAKRPMSGAAWDNVLAAAQKDTSSPNLADQNDMTNVYVMAKGLVYARTGEEHYRTEVRSAIRAAMGTEGWHPAALGRDLIAYIIAADLVVLPPDEDQVFREYLSMVRHKELCCHFTGGGKTLISQHEDRPNNIGNQAGGTRAAIAAYLDDREELARVAQILKGFLGDLSSYAGFTYKFDFSWHLDANKPVGINPKGAMKNGHSIDGVIPDDQRRCGGFQWPPCKTNYAWEGQQGYLAQAVILHRAGYSEVWQWGDQAIMRAQKWLHDTTFSDGKNYPAQGDDTWQPHIINYYYGTHFPAPVPSKPGKNVGWTDWTHGKAKKPPGNDPGDPGSCDGDLNKDGGIDVGDLQILVNVLLSGAKISCADVDRDGEVDVRDLQAEVNLIAGK